MKSKIYILFFLVFSSFSTAYANCYDNLAWDIKKYGNAADFEITNFSNKTILIKDFSFFDKGSNLIFKVKAGWLISKKNTINRRIVKDQIKLSKEVNLTCQYASTNLNPNNSNNSKNSRFSSPIKKDSDLVMYLIIGFVLIAFIIFASTKSKRNKPTIDSSSRNTSRKESSDEKKKSPLYKKIFLITLIAPVVANVAYSLHGGKGISSMTFPLLIGGLAWTLIAYFASKATKASSNKLKKEISKTMDTKPDTNKSLKEVVHDKIQDNKEKKEKQVLKEDEIYDQIGKEIEEDKKIRSVWTKALAQADGDVNKAESQYIKLRFDQLNR